MNLTPELAAALDRGRDATKRMACATSDDDYLNAAAALGNAFRDIDRILTGKKD